MGRPKSLPETFRECLSCKLVMPLTEEHWYANSGCRNGFMSPCRGCCRTRKKVYAIRASKPIRFGMVGTHCGECYDLPHRVTGGTCFSCGLRYEAEPKPELQLRKYAGDVL